ncbi:MAG: 30S ribosomal protein S6 [Bacilli bacterium]|nr:30S ribosomal protein S6 [Bacilli bacterium]
MGKYEIMYILSADLTEEARKAEIEKLHKIITDHKGQVKEVKEWGLRDFAYPMKKQTKGYYVIIKASADKACLDEFTRLVKLDNQVIRHLITVDQK